ncbi:ABC transporter ATP-binding protein [Pedobacter psychrophilus]|uniref:ABC transporter ATP-binding protein n=1 Tax=Pedobacter psychrophilus TaxID=1826909 RepID=A0A179DGQ0_9SPHI|nr:ABC transporter ATP-binding protein [Pedobacter psychrophilus]OAQ39679.1 ABC transporter ATP-binding protein [Pedobacter psychrophilus]
MAQLTINNLEISFKSEESQFKAIDHISLQLNKGEIIGLVGESGSGKSVTSLAIMRLLEANAKITGEILFDDKNLLEIPEKEMQQYRGNKIAMIFQEPMTSLNPLMKCGKQITESIILHLKINKKQAKEKTIQLFEEVKLPEPQEVFDEYPHQISGGQKQRVMIAMALACNPQILIADEPTTALDVTVQKNIIELLKRIRLERNMSMIFISHDLGVIGEIADKILVMNKGQIVEQGTAKDIFLNPQHPYTKGLLACRPNPRLQLKKLPTISDFTSEKNGQFTTNAITIEDLQQQLKVDDGEISQKRKLLYLQPRILKVENLNTWFPKNQSFFGKADNFTKAVNDVSFEVFTGETFGLVGESGCGKTTLSRTILKLIEPTSGKIIFNEVDISNLNEKEMRPLRKDIQIIFQDPYSSLNPVKTIGEALIEPLVVHKILTNYQERKDYIINLMEKVGLTAQQFNRYPHEFSGGQRQRIVIARALALKPKLIICDECVSALDVSVQAQVINLLKDLQQEFKLTYIFISHDMAVVKHVSDRMMVMNNGQIEEIGYPEDIYHHPKKAYTQKLINAIPKGIY